jgi:ankyrin repeat protein
MIRRLLTATCLGVFGALSLTVLLHAAPPDAAVANAAMQGDKDAVRALLKQGVDVNAAQGDGMTALHWAAKRGDAELAQMLVYAGANVKATTRLGAYTALTLAAREGHAEVIATLLAAGADPNGATSSGTTPLMLAAASGNARAVTMLVENGAKIEARENAMQQTALMFASAYNRVDAMKALIKLGADMKATSKVVDLAALTAPEQEFRQGGGQGQGQGGPAQAGRGPAQGLPAGAPGGSGGAAAGGGRGRPEGQQAQGGQAPQGGGQQAAAGQGQGQGRGGRGGPPGGGVAGVDRQFRFNELVAYQGGMTPLLLAARQGHMDAVQLLVDAGADVNQTSAGDKTSPLMIAVINGHFDIGKLLLDKGANPNALGDNGAGPLYGVLNVQWAPKALYPQPRAYQQQKLTHIEMMKALLEKGANPNVRLKKKVWYSGYNFDLAGVDEIGATPFWRAAYASDVDAMKLLVSHGADPQMPTSKPAGRPQTGDGGREQVDDLSGKAPVPTGGPGVPPLQAAAGVGYGEGFAANSHRFAPIGQLAAVKYLVEEIGADVNAVDHEGNTALHHAAARGDVEMMLYLVSKGADITLINREGNSIADMANGPVQRVQPYPQALSLALKLGAKNRNKCVSC